MMLDVLDGRRTARELPSTVRQAPPRLPGRPAPATAPSALLPGGRPCHPTHRVITAQTRTVVITAQTRTVRRRATNSTVAGAPC